MAHLRPVLLVEDNPNDVELTLAALEKSRLANPVVVARDGVEALDHLFRRSNAEPECASAVPLPAVVLLDIKLPRVDGLGRVDSYLSQSTVAARVTMAR